jgi:hypothetical protein
VTVVTETAGVAEPDIVFPELARPEVSILVVTYGAPDVAKKCLALLAERTPPVAEVIVVDNGGPDSPAGFLSSHVHGATFVRNERNVGFGAANGQAAALARAPLLFLLNPDAFVNEGWLPPLLETAARDPRAGAIAPRVLNADGTLQESGGLVFGRGLTRFNGFGRIRRPAHLLPRVADRLGLGPPREDPPLPRGGRLRSPTRPLTTGVDLQLAFPSAASTRVSSRAPS